MSRMSRRMKRMSESASTKILTSRQSAARALRHQNALDQVTGSGSTRRVFEERVWMRKSYTEFRPPRRCAAASGVRQIARLERVGVVEIELAAFCRGQIGRVKVVRGSCSIKAI